MSIFDTSMFDIWQCLIHLCNEKKVYI
jgi:hypothetical protein